MIFNSGGHRKVYKSSARVQFERTRQPRKSAVRSIRTLTRLGGNGKNASVWGSSMTKASVQSAPKPIQTSSIKKECGRLGLAAGWKDRNVSWGSALENQPPRDKPNESLRQLPANNDTTPKSAGMLCQPPAPPVIEEGPKNSHSSFAWGNAADEKDSESIKNDDNCLNHANTSKEGSADLEEIKNNRVSWCDLNDEDSDDGHLISAGQYTQRRDCHEEGRLHCDPIRYHNAPRDHPYFCRNKDRYSLKISRDFDHRINRIDRKNDRFPQYSDDRRDDRFGDYHNRQVCGHNHDVYSRDGDLRHHNSVKQATNFNWRGRMPRSQPRSLYTGYETSNQIKFTTGVSIVDSEVKVLTKKSNEDVEPRSLDGEQGLPCQVVSGREPSTFSRSTTNNESIVSEVSEKELEKGIEINVRTDQVHSRNFMKEQQKRVLQYVQQERRKQSKMKRSRRKKSDTKLITVKKRTQEKDHEFEEDECKIKCKDSSRRKIVTTEGQSNNHFVAKKGHKRNVIKHIPRTSGVLYRRLPDSNILVNADLGLSDEQIKRILEHRKSSKKATRKSKSKTEKKKPKSVVAKPFIPARSPSIPAWQQGPPSNLNTSSFSTDVTTDLQSGILKSDVLSMPSGLGFDKLVCFGTMIPTLPRDLLASDDESDDDKGTHVACSKDNDKVNADNEKKKKRTKKRWKKKKKPKTKLSAKCFSDDGSEEATPIRKGQREIAAISNQSKSQAKDESVKAATKKKKFWKRRRPFKKQNYASAEQE